MSAAPDWLRARRPAPPSGLRPWLSVAGPDGRSVRATLTAAGLQELDVARARLGPVRESALHLLAADALITYACEAALEESDPRVALTEVLRAVAPPPRVGA